MASALKRRVFELVEPSHAGDRLGHFLDYFIIGLIGANVVAVVLGTVPSVAAEYGVFLDLFEWFSVAVFTVEYVLHLWSCTVVPRYSRPISGRVRYALRPMLLVDLFAILPFYLPLIFGADLRFLRALRLFRLFRVLKIARYSRSLQILGNVFNARKADLLVTLFTVLILVILTSSLMYFAETEAQPDAFPHIPAAMWWAIVTLTTVGYGDIAPITLAGRILGGFVAILGIGLVALPAGILAAGFSDEMNRRRKEEAHP